MHPVVSVAEMRQADAQATTPVEVLIQRAGRAVALEAQAMLGGTYGRRIVVVAGKGNNGADGRAAGSFLTQRGATVSVVAPGDLEVVPPCDLVIDAAFGTGFKGSYRAPFGGDSPVLSVDIPSGVDGDTGVASPGAVWATATVTMAALKPGQLLVAGPDRAGRIRVADIGLPVPVVGAWLIEDADAGWLPGRPLSTHKWSQAVWVMAGSPGMRGAASLCARAAQRAGAGMLHVGSPGLSAAEHPPGEAVYVGLPSSEWATVVLKELERFKALVVGPGLGRSEETTASVRELVSGSSVPTVVDADGLFALGSASEASSVIRARTGSAPVVLTPHDGEFTRLAGGPPGDDRLGAARDLAARTGATVLLKGSTTVVASPGGAALLAVAGDARLATAGTGDVLSGVIGAFLAGGVASGPDGGSGGPAPGSDLALRAAALGAHVHGRAAQRGLALGLVAGDLPDLVARFLSDVAPGPSGLHIDFAPGGG